MLSACQVDFAPLAGVGELGGGAADGEAVGDGEPVAPAVAGLADGVASDLAESPALSALPAVGALPPASAGLSLGLAAPSRKSVTYQPDPLSWNPAAVNCLAKASAPHDEHVVSTGSLSFCKTSRVWPQAPQR